MTTVLVAVQDSAAALAAADTAIEMVRRLGGRLCAVAVVERDPASPGSQA